MVLMVTRVSIGQTIPSTNVLYWTKTEEGAFKSGVATGYAYALLHLSTNDLSHLSLESAHLLSEEAWHDFTNKSVYAKIASSGTIKEITNTGPIMVTNGIIRWLESPMTVPVLVYHTNGWEEDSLWNSYRYTDPTIQIGLGSDGAVVWRKRPQDK